MSMITENKNRDESDTFERAAKVLYAALCSRFFCGRVPTRKPTKPVPEARASRDLRGHAPPGNFEN